MKSDGVDGKIIVNCKEVPCYSYSRPTRSGIVENPETKCEVKICQNISAKLDGRLSTYVQDWYYVCLLLKAKQRSNGVMVRKGTDKMLFCLYLIEIETCKTY